MSWLILTPDRNTSGKVDWKHVFAPEAKAFGELIGDHCRMGIDISRPLAGRRRQAMDAVARNRVDAQNLALFCHGWSRGVQVGWWLPKVDDLASILASRSISPTVALFACSTAGSPRGAPGGDGGFADQLRDALCRAGATKCRVIGHDRLGHATRNPYVVEFRGDGSPTGGQGGQWIVAPKSALWRRWAWALRNTDLRLRQALMSTAEIHAELATLRPT